MHKLIWFDIANSPHVMFFKPIVEKIGKYFDVFITAREFSETLELLDSFGLKYVKVGKHGGRSKVGKLLSSIQRIREFVGILDNIKPYLAVSHNSYDQIVASKLMGIKSMTFMDYDKQPANHVAFRLSNLVVVQEWFPDDALVKFGTRRFVRYKGLKEEVYIDGFKPDFEAVRGFNIKRPFVVARPPSVLSLYSKGYGIFWKVLVRLKGMGCDVRVITRNPEDGEICRNLKIQTLPRPVDGLQVIYWADAFVGGGGTMTRESVILGTPAYSVIPNPGYLDKILSKMGYIRFVEVPEDVRISEKREFSIKRFNPNILGDIVDIILGEVEG